MSVLWRMLAGVVAALVLVLSLREYLAPFEFLTVIILPIAAGVIWGVAHARKLERRASARDKQA